MKTKLLTLCAGVILSLNDFMSSPFPFAKTFAIESTECFATNAESKAAIFSNFVFIALAGTPRTPWHFLQFAS